MNLQAVYAKDKFMKLESFIIEIIEKRKKTFWTKGLEFILLFFSFVFKSGVQCKNFFYDKGFFQTKKVNIPVISIGNIVAGGTGKTSFISFLSAKLSQNKKLAVLSRGYRSKIANTNAVMEISNGIGPLFPVDICGDEPFLLANLIPQATIIVGRDRVKAAKMATDLKSKIILLDDGMQYRRLHRDLEVVLLHASDPFGKKAFLPRGYLRDNPKRLKNADLIVIHQVNSSENFFSIEKQVRKYSQAPLIGTKAVIEKIFEIPSQSPIDVKGEKVGVFCSIGKPVSFAATVQAAQCNIVGQLFFPDHARFQKKQIFSFAENCREKGAKWLLCTEKDGVKISDCHESPLPIAVVKTSLEIIEGKEELQNFIHKVETLGGTDEALD
ncbi:MAG: tetraacyldisaccharide 4'-kinase [Simkaniaceae bacterium]